MTIGEQVASLRKAKGWSQAELAKQTGLSASTVAMYETNRRTPDDTRLKLLADVLGVHVNTLQTEHSAEPTPLVQDQQQVPSSYQSLQPLSGEIPVHMNPADQDLHLQVSMDEARVILAMRMAPGLRSFILSYVNASNEDRERVERTWHILKSFQSTSK